LKQVLLITKGDKIRHARGLAENRAEIRAESRDAAELKRKRCKTLERKIAKVQENATWLKGASPSMQKSGIGEDSEHLVSVAATTRSGMAIAMLYGLQRSVPKKDSPEREWCRLLGHVFKHLETPYKEDMVKRHRALLLGKLPAKEVAQRKGRGGGAGAGAGGGG
jgi:hypothetical protein